MKKPNSPTQWGIIIGAALTVIYALRAIIGSIIETFLRGKADTQSDELSANIKKQEGIVNEANKNSTNSLDEYRKLKRKYDENN